MELKVELDGEVDLNIISLTWPVILPNERRLLDERTRNALGSLGEPFRQSSAQLQARLQLLTAMGPMHFHLFIHGPLTAGHEALLDAVLPWAAFVEVYPSREVVGAIEHLDVLRYRGVALYTGSLVPWRWAKRWTRSVLNQTLPEFKAPTCPDQTNILELSIIPEDDRCTPTYLCMAKGTAPQKLHVQFDYPITLTAVRAALGRGDTRIVVDAIDGFVLDTFDDPTACDGLVLRYSPHVLLEADPAPKAFFASTPVPDCVEWSVLQSFRDNLTVERAVALTRMMAGGFKAATDKKHFGNTVTRQPVLTTLGLAAALAFRVLPDEALVLLAWWDIVAVMQGRAFLFQRRCDTT